MTIAFKRELRLLIPYIENWLHLSAERVQDIYLQAKNAGQVPGAGSMYFGIVYCVTNNRNEMKYIGATTRTLEYVQRRYNGRRDSYRNGPIFRAIREFGPENFSIKRLGSAHNKRELQELKLSFIENFNTRIPNGYNDHLIARVTPTPVVCVEKSVIYDTVLQAADSVSCDVDSVLQAIHTQETLAGYHWKYIERHP